MSLGLFPENAIRIASVVRNAPSPLIVWTENLKESVSIYYSLIEEGDFSVYFKYPGSSGNLRFLIGRALTPHRTIFSNMNKLKRYKNCTEHNAIINRKGNRRNGDKALDIKSGGAEESRTDKVPHTRSSGPVAPFLMV